MGRRQAGWVAGGRGLRPLPGFPGVKCYSGGKPGICLDPAWSGGLSYNLRQLTCSRTLGGEKRSLEAVCEPPAWGEGSGAASLKQQR